jgi:hypothetical protein
MELISFAAVTAKAASDRGVWVRLRNEHRLRATWDGARHPPGVKGRVELSPLPAGGWRFRPDNQSGRA